MTSADPPAGVSAGRQWSRSTWVRLTVISALVLAFALATTVALAWQLAGVQGRTAVDDRLLREHEVFAARAPGLLRGAGSGADAAGIADLERRFTAYLATQPGSAQHLTAIRLPGRPPLVTRLGPEPVVRLATEGRLPDGEPGRLVSRDTTAGDLRVLATPVNLDGRQVAVVVVYGSLAVADSEATRLTGGVALAALLAGLAGLAILALALRTATQPLRALHEAAERSRIGDLGVRVPDLGDRGDEVADLARAFNAMLDRLSTEIDSRTALFASVSHELRTPVAIARGHLELVESGSAADPSASLRLVGTELGRLSRLLDDLLLLAAADSDAFLVPSEVSLGRVVEEIRLRIVGLDLAGVTVESAPDQASPVLVDLDRALQAVTNLVVNARRHTPPQTAVTVTVRVDAGVLDVSVADNGPGIPPELRERVFEPFARRGRGSTGLGLAVVRAVALAHGGQVDLDTGAHGTAIRLRFGGGSGDP
ncbi:MAG: HAMP domain-containing histidine kinase [Kineosporiaceae bacterium]|nr:HAMP domain-containing histidine kinase [Kineosporiaceae bacterium]